MQIPIKLAKPGEIPEWYLIELQGTLEATDLGSLDQQSIGNLFFTKQGEPILIIGHHELRGKEVKLDKPILILRKKNADVGQSFDSSPTISSSRIGYEIDAVARRKILFKSRPKPIVTGPISKTAKQSSSKPHSENASVTLS